jgi:hypothetical protein
MDIAFSLLLFGNRHAYRRVLACASAVTLAISLPTNIRPSSTHHFGHGDLALVGNRRQQPG